MRPRKRAKDKLKLIRSWLNGEDVAKHVLPANPTVIFLPLNNRDAVRGFSEINFYAPAIQERKTYRDPDFPGIEYVNPETLKDIENFKHSESLGTARLTEQPSPDVNIPKKNEPVESAENNEQRFIIHRGRKIPLDEFSWAHEAWIRN